MKCNSMRYTTTKITTTPRALQHQSYSQRYAHPSSDLETDLEARSNPFALEAEEVTLVRDPVLGGNSGIE